jgi:hypothetical protein
MDILKYSAPKFNAAQQILMACGVDDLRLVAHHHNGGNKSHTKTGPGRTHAQGNGDHTNAKVSPRSAAGIGFQQHTNPSKVARREMVARMGRRQAIKFLKLAKRNPGSPSVQGF